MKRLATGIAALLAICFLNGCSAGGSSQDDSMSPMLEQAKKDQGVNTTAVKPKDEANHKASPAPDTGGSDVPAKPPEGAPAKPPTGSTGK